MLVVGLFKRLLPLGRERIVGIEPVQEGEVVVVDVALPARTRCELRCEIRRIKCPECGIRSEQVPWDRAGSRFTRAVEDTCVFLARAAPKVVVAQLMRIDWGTVGGMIERV